VACNFQTGNRKVKLLAEYESIIQKVLFGNSVLPALMSGRKYDVVPQNGDCSREVHGNPDSNLESLCIREVRIKSTIFCEMMTFGPLHVHRRFGETCCLHHQGQAVLAALVLLLGLLFDLPS
jgi:hypothetical protein